jgi:hypothetical protein
MGTIHMGTIPMAITGHIRTIMGLHTIGMAGIGTTATTAIITTIGINVAWDVNPLSWLGSVPSQLFFGPTCRSAAG